jgi:hypothetical protein
MVTRGMTGSHVPGTILAPGIYSPEPGRGACAQNDTSGGGWLYVGAKAPTPSGAEGCKRDSSTLGRDVRFAHADRSVASLRSE